LESFESLDDESLGYIEEWDFIIALFMSMGCDLDKSGVIDLYSKVFDRGMTKPPKLYPDEFLRMMN
jgi:hypothetical protein